MDATLVRSPESPPRGVIAATSVRLSDIPARVGPPEEVPPQPTVEVVRNGGVVQAIDIVCPCGQHTRLHCLYD